MLAKSLVDQGLVDEVWMLVSPLNPFKQSKTHEFAPYDDRLRMTQLAVAPFAGLRVSDFENHLPRPSYMINTLDALAETYPEHQFVLVIGADNWQRFAQWYKSDEIRERYEILIYRRPGYELPAGINVVDTPLYDISSTEIREAVRRDEPPRQWLSPEVVGYITERNLYK